jgi:hypothetical protein
MADIFFAAAVQRYLIGSTVPPPTILTLLIAPLVFLLFYVAGTYANTLCLPTLAYGLTHRNVSKKCVGLFYFLY